MLAIITLLSAGTSQQVDILYHLLVKHKMMFSEKSFLPFPTAFRHLFQLQLLQWKCSVLCIYKSISRRWCLDWLWIVLKSHTEATFRRILKLIYENVCLHDVYNCASGIFPPAADHISVSQYLWRSSGPGCIEDIERVVWGNRNTVMRSSCSHLLLPVQTQLRTHWHFFLKTKKKGGT